MAQVLAQSSGRLLRSPILGAAACVLLGCASETVELAASGNGTGSGGNEGSGLVPSGESALVVNELVASNEGVLVDERGETDDLIELVNATEAAIDLGEFALSDDNNSPAPLPSRILEPGERVVVWSDDEPGQGPLHLPFKLSSDGELVRVWRSAEELLTEVRFPQLARNEAFARFPDLSGDFSRCRYATPGRPNGDSCGPPPPPVLPQTVSFQPYAWQLPYPPVTGPLAISELALRPAEFVELLNVTSDPVNLNEFEVRLGPTEPGVEFPGPADGVQLPLPDGVALAAGEHLTIDVAADDVAALAAGPEFEGALSLFRVGETEPVDRVDFMSWPDGAVLARQPEPDGRHVFCATATRGAPNDDCDPLATRPVGNRLRHLRTPEDFAALAEGATNLGMESVKFVIDLQQGEAVHLLSSRTWDLHYTFVRENVYGEPHLDRCIPAERNAFNVGWYEFSQTEYLVAEGRRFLGGTLVHHGGADLHTVEFAMGDEISPDHLELAFFRMMRHVMDPSLWALRPQDDSQTNRALDIDGRLPIVDSNAPFVGMTYQPLTEGLAYGVLRFVPTAELDEAPLGFDAIVVTDDVPNDIPLVGGLITEAFQTPLAHVNVLSQSRNTPNLALVNAREEPRLAPYFDTLVRLEVRGDGFDVSPADPGEARAFWESRRPSGPAQSPRLDLTVRGVQGLEDATIEWLPYIGAKAAQFAELGRVAPPSHYSCPAVVPFQRPTPALAVPVVHSVEHFEASGARAALAELQANAEFNSNPLVRADGLAVVRGLIRSHPVDPAVLGELEAAVASNFGRRRVRLRSSSNAEDLAGFNGAGLYTSTSAAIDDPERRIEDALRTVWASLYNARAYDERELARIDHADVAMGVLVHEAFLSESANGVAISRNVLNPIRSDIYYLNAQIGEASVTNPAPGVVTEQFVYRWPPRLPPIIYQSRSSLTAEQDVLSLSEVEAVACGLRAVNAHFRPLLDPAGDNPWFAMEVEFKLTGDRRQLVFKQARPHIFGGFEIIDDCREL